MRTTNSRNLRARHLGLAAMVACLGWTQVATAVPVTFVSANVWRADRSPNPIGFPAAALVPWVEISLGAGGSIADTIVTASAGSNTITLNRIATGALTGLYFAQVLDLSLASLDWTITATNTTGTTDVATRTRPAFGSVQPMPFVSDIGFTGTGNNITVNWTVTPEGAARLDQQQVTIWNVTNPLAPVTTNFFPIGAAARSVNLSGLLAADQVYAVEINNVDINNYAPVGTPPLNFTDAFSGNWLSGWSITPNGPVRVPVPEPGMLSLLLAGLGGIAAMRRRRSMKADRA